MKEAPTLPPRRLNLEARSTTKSRKTTFLQFNLVYLLLKVKIHLPHCAQGMGKRMLEQLIKRQKGQKRQWDRSAKGTKEEEQKRRERERQLNCPRISYVTRWQSKAKRTRKKEAQQEMRVTAAAAAQRTLFFSSYFSYSFTFSPSPFFSRCSCCLPPTNRLCVMCPESSVW